MPHSVDPVKIAQHVAETYRRYLATTFRFADPEFRRSFAEELGRDALLKGPYVEAIPNFRRTLTLRSLIPEVFALPVDEGLLDAVWGDRPLYSHQEAAVRAVAAGRNVIVATGTGSGKTEAFLIPILLHLYAEHLRGELAPGVRALILYPMNALAHDQRERLGEIAAKLEASGSSFRFKFGQYIGETPEDESDTRRNASDHLRNCLNSEMVFRSAMRKSPPHILLTNFSMLEYLLMRPDDSPLFDNGRARTWKFLVLDEAHQYRGARGIEMAMLIRRLKQRLREGGNRGGLRCIATSATLSGGPADSGEVAGFASKLFDEVFEEGDVILGDTETPATGGASSLESDCYGHMLATLEGGSHDGLDLTALASSIGAKVVDTEDRSRLIARILLADGRVGRLRQALIGGPATLQSVADAVFDDCPTERRIDALVKLIRLLSLVNDPNSNSPLVTFRYHVFLKALEGAFVSYWPEKRVYLDRKSVQGERVAFEVALCRECGQHYLLAPNPLRSGRLREPERDPSHPLSGITFLRPIPNTDGDGLEELSGGRDRWWLCGKCGHIDQSPLSCCHDAAIHLVAEPSPEDEGRSDRIAKCGACEFTGRDPVREVLYGAYGPHAVIATALHQNLPEQRRKVLAFADGRQEAAFFAWYLDDTYKEVLNRNLLLRAVLRAQATSVAGSSLRDLLLIFREVLQENKVLSPSAGEIEVLSDVWRRMYAEFLSEQQSICLEGVGLVRWHPKRPPWMERELVFQHEPWNLDANAAWSVVCVLLDMLRVVRAVDLRTDRGVPLMWEDLGLSGGPKSVRLGDPRGESNVQSWDGGSRGRGRWVDYLRRYLRSKRFSDEEATCHAQYALRSVWQALGTWDGGAPSEDQRLLVADGQARKLNPDWWRISPVGAEDVIYECDVCSRLQSEPGLGVCKRNKCPGFPRPKLRRDLEPNHYRTLYSASLPGPLRVEEHTAQLDHEQARKFQREFRSGQIHVLSCSTTFELGVDLGDLDTIFLRNVPPETFNYAQRVGRAGRRPGNPGFAITYCRRSPHDLYHFAEPKQILSGMVRPPALAIRNERIVLRHLVAVAASAFFRAFPERFRSVSEMFGDLSAPQFSTDLRSFLRSCRAQIEQRLEQVVPAEMRRELGLSDGSWIDRITREGRLRQSELEVSSDYRQVLNVEQAATRDRDYRTAEWAKRRANTIASEDVLSFLSRKAVIPKYGFPVDVVELDLQPTARDGHGVGLTRDLSLAISEFAPGSRLVANKLEWTSAGLRRVAEREWERRHYYRCFKHGAFCQWKDGDSEPASPCGCELRTFTYLIPRFGFIAPREQPKVPSASRPRVFSSRPFFAGPVGPEPGSVEMPPGKGHVTVTPATPGTMVVLCEGRKGQGFWVCRDCGAGFLTMTRSHRSPFGRECHGMLDPVSLGHEFTTDVVRLLFSKGSSEASDRVGFALSLAYAILHGAAEVLEVPDTDLSTTIDPRSQQVTPTIVIYDNVPGGAGLVTRLEDPTILKACLESAKSRVSGACGCDEMTSCYGCLRSYRNQFAHSVLQRGPVDSYLEMVLRDW
ncbi:MAG: DEAD/DEAH box helicase [Fimbriimonadales bacterium]